MIVMSPVGEFPYHLDEAAIEDGHLVMRGRMGTWPAQITLEWKDASQFARIARVPLVVVGMLILALIAKRIR